MKVIKPCFEILQPSPLNEETANVIRKAIEAAGRTCYKSENHITDESAKKFVRNIVRNQHEAMLEHASMTVRFTVDRGVSHELVRHRLASFAQESTRYCNYSQDKFGNELTFIEPFYFDTSDRFHLKSEWMLSMYEAEQHYFNLLSMGASPQEARAVLPNSLKTEVIMTANMREWRHFFKLRAAGTTGAPHPQMAEVAIPLLETVQQFLPELFDDIKLPT